MAFERCQIRYRTIQPGIGFYREREHDRNTSNQSIIRNPRIRLNRSTVCRTRSDANVAIESADLRLPLFTMYLHGHNRRSVAGEFVPTVFTPTGRKIALRPRRNSLAVIQG